MAEKVSTRIVVGILLLIFAFSFVGADHWLGRGIFFTIFCAMAMTAGAAEFAKLTAGVGAPAHAKLLVVTIGALVLARGIGSDLKLAWLVAAETPILVAFAFCLLLPALLGVPSRERFLSLASTTLGLFYVWFLGSFIVRIRFIELEGLDGETAATFAVLVAKTPDICAYFLGKSLGKTKLIPSVSPGKTVAGFVGALLGATLVTVLFSSFTSVGNVIPPRWSVPFAIVFGLVSVSGDLVESFFKRGAALKDSASLFPTFGGVLDVIDSFLISSPAVYYLLHAAAALRRTQV